MTETITRVICDAGPIIHLDELDSLDLLADFQEIIIPGSVCNEIRRCRPSALERRDFPLTALTEKVFPDESLATMIRIFSLDAGETEALAIMSKNPQAMLLTDDAAARLVAHQMGFRVHGTVGILVRSIRRGLREPQEVIHVLADIPAKSTLHIKRSLLNEITSRIKKEFNLW
jgi:predicted nucleic acid-binding protein